MKLVVIVAGKRDPATSFLLFPNAGIAGWFAKASARAYLMDGRGLITEISLRTACTNAMQAGLKGL